MLNFFKSGNKEQTKDVKSIREDVLRFVKEQLQKMEGEGGHIKGIELFITCNNSDKHLYDMALLNAENADYFKNEVQRIADDYALALPGNWAMEINFTDVTPPEATPATYLPAALFIRTKDHFVKKEVKAYINVLSGKAEQDEYEILSSGPKITIGRERQVQVNDGFFRRNAIAFPGDLAQENVYISRQHAHIEWDAEAGTFMLYADEGGVPPGNKIKIRAVNNEALIKLNSTEIGHQLQEGDQVILGESAVIEFSYQSSKQ